MPIAALREMDGTTPARLVPGDLLTGTVRLYDGEQAQTISVDADLLAWSAIGPPAAVYSLVDVVRQSALLTAETTLHATAPMPQRTEFPALMSDLERSHVRRRAQFIWRTPG